MKVDDEMKPKLMIKSKFIPLGDISRFDPTVTSDSKDIGKVIHADFRNSLDVPDESDDSGAGGDDHALSNFVSGFDFVDPRIDTSKFDLVEGSIGNNSPSSVNGTAKPEMEKSSTLTDVNNSETKNRT